MKTPWFPLATMASALLASLLGSDRGQTRVRPWSDPGLTPTLQQAAARPADDQAAALFGRLCNECHDTARITSLRRTRPDWEDVITKMVEKGAGGTEKELETVFEYLVRTYGKVFINSAKAEEIATVLGLSAKDAEAIVAFRSANGKFADLDALKKVPDIDLKKIEERRDAVAF
jgi:competence ComEA-like helix-hairpin-helix protein